MMVAYFLLRHRKLLLSTRFLGVEGRFLVDEALLIGLMGPFSIRSPLCALSTMFITDSIDDSLLSVASLSVEAINSNSRSDDSFIDLGRG